MTTPGTETAPATPPAGPPRYARFLAWSGVAVVVLGTAYATGRLQTASKISDAEERAGAANQARDRTSEDLRGERAEVLRLEARRRLHLALLALEDRNFGIAQAHVDAAAGLLAQGSSGAPAGIGDLQRELAAARLVATEDLGQQRQRLLDVVRRFDTLEPPANAAK
jgi:hypothetical protein